MAQDVTNAISSRLLRPTGLIFDVGKWFFVIVVALILIQTLLVTFRVVDGDSMLPNYVSGSIMAVDRRDWITFQRGDAVVLHYPGDPERLQFVKRIVGLPGEMLEIKNGQVFINGAQLPEPYLPATTTTTPAVALKRIAENEYFTMGDNRDFSNDSRFFGSVHKRYILGKVITVVYKPKNKTVY
ncbi:signal peptidase I [Candidatus Berkelbacteria bacterium]|nr:signal peptidase I [Candidatus Berkelbacteria bacterium]